MADDLNMNGTLYVCATAQHNTELNQAAYEALTWVEIGNIVTFPQIGFEANVVTQNYVNTDFSADAKGFINGTASDISVGRAPDDAGQVILRTAANSRYRYAFKREYADAVSGYTATFTYFRALVTSELDAGGGGEEFDNETFGIKVTAQKPIIVAPEAV
jgi:hypothetical protein